MKIIIRVLLYILASSTISRACGSEMVYRGSSDASAAVAIGRDMFIVADDESNAPPAG